MGRKILTFSYDDGVESDVRLIRLWNRYGLRGTVNLNAGLLGGGSVFSYRDFTVRRLSVEQAACLYQRTRDSRPWAETICLWKSWRIMTAFISSMKINVSWKPYSEYRLSGLHIRLALMIPMYATSRYAAGLRMPVQQK